MHVLMCMCLLVLIVLGTNPIVHYNLFSNLAMNNIKIHMPNEVLGNQINSYSIKYCCIHKHN
jgi:hypothetical protein